MEKNPILRDELFWFDFQGNSFVNVVWQSRDGRMTVASKILILKGILYKCRVTVVVSDRSKSEGESKSESEGENFFVSDFAETWHICSSQ